MNKTNNLDSNFIEELKNKRDSTLSGIFAFIGSINLMIALVIYLHWWEQFTYYGFLEIINENLMELDFLANAEWFFLFIALASNVVSLVLASMEFNKKAISRDRLFVHISLVVFNFFLFISYYV